MCLILLSMSYLPYDCYVKTSGYFSYFTANARQEVHMVQQVGTENAFLHLLVGEESGFLT